LVHSDHILKALDVIEGLIQKVSLDPSN
jgi:hypothetical protein